ncbi:hypothetical protein KAS06_02955, partial [Candidatus Bathyarchaeota archaeon]|nr:hypothetical protein [Candidatus Bathyarchaeota archaeon]
MLFDVVLPAIISVITIAIVWLYPKFRIKIESLFEDKEFRVLDVFFLVVVMAVMVTVIVFIPEQAIQILFLGAYSFVLFLFTYIAVEKWFFAVLPPIIFLALYYSGFWGGFLPTLFAVIFVISISVYVGSLFSWTTALVFAALITIMDFIQVIGTKFMGQAAEKVMGLQLPVAIQVPTFPIEGEVILGLGDLFLAGLLSIQISKKYNRRAGVISAISIGIAFFIFEVLAIYFRLETYF